MPHVIKVVANAEGRYPVKLYGTEYEIEPVKSKTTEKADQAKRETGKPAELKTADGSPAQPTTEDNKPKA